MRLASGGRQQVEIAGSDAHNDNAAGHACPPGSRAAANQCDLAASRGCQFSTGALATATVTFGNFCFSTRRPVMPADTASGPLACEQCGGFGDTRHPRTACA